ncbi:MAG: tetratricopeptide repeat protein, partial [Oscillatoriales cyanobacterium C42_A2020_001]|nr:tetratricopeptide repeat protein [Leptolyngbyaceae cyanobacterium C42_A2020_001]
DRVQTALATLTSTIDVLPSTQASLEKLTQLDKTLRQQTAAIAPLTQDDQWRASFKPDETAWWWFLKVKEPSEPFSWLWSAAALASITASFSLMGDIVPRFLVGGPDLLSSFLITLQSLGGLLSTGAVVKAIQATPQQPMGDRILPKHWWGKASAGLAGLVLLGVVGLRLSLPYWSDRYTQWGMENYRNGNWSSAESDYQRALKLNPDNVQAHLYAGVLSEDLQEFDKARSHYQLAIQGGSPTAINNLARLQILTKKDYAAAVALLLKALDDEKHQPLNPVTKHAVLKNLGWARLQQKNYPDAEARLLEAIEMQPTIQFENDDRRREAIADTHCLLAQVMEGLGDKQAALAKWKICNQNLNITIPEHDAWNAIAEQRLTPQETRP